jgi:outer membrane murein-binding lipoprotein Lpp
MPAWLIWLIVIVVVVVVIAAVIAATGKRRTEGRRQRAEQLRDEASTHAAVLPESERQAEELRAKADLARTEATRAEERAADAEQGHRIEQASYEDKLREADRLDPEVDHQQSDYEPDVWKDDESTAPQASAGPRHAATSDETTSEGTTER